MKYLLLILIVFFIGCSSNSSVNDSDFINMDEESDVIIDLDSDLSGDSDLMDQDENDDDVLNDNNVLVTLSKWEKVSNGFEVNYHSSSSVVNLNDKYFFVAGDEVYSSDNGVDWVTVNYNAPFKSRTEHSLISFKGRMYLIGGGPYTSLGDIWCSEDGKDWDFLTGKSPFGARRGLSAIVFNEKVWVIGGVLNAGSCEQCNGSEIWSSDDLKTWEISVNQAAFGEILFQKVIEHNGELWLFGTDSENSKKVIWRSSDGTTWEKVTDTLPFEKRNEAVFYSWKDSLWIAGGYDDNSNVLNDVWSSDDGINWSKAGDFGELDPRYKSVAVTTEEEVLLLSGNYQGTVPLKEIISTKDGKTWSARWGTQALPDRFSRTVNYFQDKFWAIGGRTSVPTPDNEYYMRDIYSSADGKLWELVDSEAPFGERAYHSSVVYQDKLWIFGGYAGSDNYVGDVWNSSDGMIWNVQLVDAPFHKRHVQDVAVYNNEIVLIDEGADGSSASFWYSSDGIEWKKGESMAFMKCRNSRLLAHEGSLFMIGGCTEDKYGNEVYKKESDGEWKQLETENIFSPRWKFGLASMGGFIWVIGGSDGDDLNEIWYSKDGKKWLQENKAAFSPRSQFSVEVHDSKLWVFGGGCLEENSKDFGDVWTAEIESVMPEEENSEKVDENPDFNDVKWVSSGEKMPEGRFRHSFIKTEDGFYVIGGKLWGDDLYEDVSSVFFSNDGSSWETLVTENDLLDKEGAAYVYFNGRFWGIGGDTGSNYAYGLTVTNEIISSENGKDWQIVVENPDFPPRYNHNVAVFKDKLWIVGGFDPDGNGLKDVWSSGDGISWQKEASDTGFRGRGTNGLHVLNGKLYFIGGMRNSWDNGTSEVWSTEDGVNWQMESYRGFSQRQMFGSAVAAGSLWVFGGLGHEDELNDLYYSIDGKIWKQADCSAPVSIRKGAVLLGDGDRLWLSGGVETDSSYDSHTYNDVWYTDIKEKGL